MIWICDSLHKGMYLSVIPVLLLEKKSSEKIYIN